MPVPPPAVPLAPLSPPAARPRATAVVFAYHEVGVRGLKTLLAHGLDVRLVVTHDDDPAETVFFASVAETARLYGLPVATPADAAGDDLHARVAALAPDFVFSFYYRKMLPARLLDVPTRGAFNLHGSLLPAFRGRAPVNWAVLKGATETGASLHAMTAKPDAGAVYARRAVPIGPDDTAHEVFAKVVVAAELALDAALPGLLDGSLAGESQDLAQGSYFGGRRPEDGRVNFGQGPQAVHDLVRAVTRPYPGAFADTPDGGRLALWRTLSPRLPGGRPAGALPGVDGGADAGVALVADADARLWLRWPDGGGLRVIEATLDGRPLGAADAPRRVA